MRLAQVRWSDTMMQSMILAIRVSKLISSSGSGSQGHLT
jgi:hypothetical protein